MISSVYQRAVDLGAMFIGLARYVVDREVVPLTIGVTVSRDGVHVVCMQMAWGQFVVTFAGVEGIETWTPHGRTWTVSEHPDYMPCAVQVFAVELPDAVHEQPDPHPITVRVSP